MRMHFEEVRTTESKRKGNGRGVPKCSTTGARTEKQSPERVGIRELPSHGFHTLETIWGVVINIVATAIICNHTSDSLRRHCVLSWSGLLQ